MRHDARTRGAESGRSPVSWFDEAGAGQQVDVAALMDSGVTDPLWVIVQGGALVSIGRTSDGGALGITVTMDGRYRREYFRETDELLDWLGAAAEAVGEEAVRLAASSAPRSRPRGRQKGL